MNQINAVTIGKLIAAHREGDEEKFKAYVDFIAKAYLHILSGHLCSLQRQKHQADAPLAG